MRQPPINDLRKQSLKDFSIFIIHLEEVKITLENEDILPLITVIPCKKKYNFFQESLETIKKLNEDFIILLNGNNLNHPNRFQLQLNYLNRNSLKVCSCLESSITYKNLDISSNLFISKEHIDLAIKSYYVPINPYTLMINTAFLKLLLLDSTYKTIYSELDFTLFLLKYTQIEKLNKILYFYSVPLLPYKENIIIDATTSSNNKIYIFNKSNYLTQRTFNLELLKNLKFKKLPPKTIFSFNILIILNSSTLGGTETYVISLSKLLMKIGIKIHLLNFNTNTFNLFFQDFVNIVPLNSITNFNLNYLKKITKDLKINLVNLQDFSLFEQLDSLDIPKSLNLILTIHGNYYDKDSLKKYSPYITHVIFVSKSLYYFYKNSFIISHYSIIENFYEPTYNLDNSLNIIDKDSKIILYSSRLNSTKGKLALDFLKSVSPLLSTNNKIKILILGDGSNRLLVENYIKKINSKFNEEKIIMLGQVSNPEKYYIKSSIVIGTGRVSLESLCYSIPTIAIGSAGYFGIIDHNNIENMLFNNFGDHKDNNKMCTYDFSKLQCDINKILLNRAYHESLKKYYKEKLPKILYDIKKKTLDFYNKFR